MRLVIVICAFFSVTLWHGIKAINTTDELPKLGDCFNYAGGDQYQEKLKCRCVVFQGPGLGDWRFSSEMIASKKSRCIIYLFLADFSDKIHVALGKAPKGATLVSVPNKTLATNIGPHCQSNNLLPITASFSTFQIRIFTHLVRPELNDFDEYSHVLCQSRYDSKNIFTFSSENRVLAVQVLWQPQTSTNSKQLELGGNFNFYPDPKTSHNNNGNKIEKENYSVRIVSIDNKKESDTKTRPISNGLTTPHGDYNVPKGSKVTAAMQTRPATQTTISSRLTKWETIEPAPNYEDEGSVWYSSECDQNITFRTHLSHSPENPKSGIISSPGFPNNYPMPGTVCKYFFKATGPGSKTMRIQINFVELNLKLPPYAVAKNEQRTSLMCNGQVDHMRISFPAAPTHPLKFCGKNRPYAVMSPTSSLELFFVTEPALSSYSNEQPDTPRGFQFQYKFIQTETKSDRIDTYTKEMTGSARKKTGCEVLFRSWQMSNGSFSSINHPGFYPRNFKCTYHFIGRTNERVNLVFGFFDVRSSSTNCSNGDFIQIEYPMAAKANSKYFRKKMLKTSVNATRTNDKFIRYCSTRRPHGSILSNWPHLVLKFHTDSINDGRGFDGYFQFVTISEPSARQSQRAGAQLSSAANTASESITVLIFVVLYIVN